MTWRLLHRKLPTNENLRIRGCTLVSICVLCYASDETSSHLFLSCKFAVHLWHWLGSRLNCAIQVLFILFYLESTHVHCSSQVRDIFIGAIIHTFHIIWLARNDLCFGSNMVSLDVAKAKIIALVTFDGIKLQLHGLPK